MKERPGRGNRIQDIWVKTMKVIYSLINQMLLVVSADVNVFGLYSEEEIENFRCIFQMFDKDKSGYVEVVDL